MESNLLYSFFKLLIALPFVIGLAYLSLRLGRNYMYNASRGKSVRVLETTPITNKAYVSVVKVGDEHMVLGVSEGKVSLLKTLNEQEAQVFEKRQEIDSVQKQFATVKDWIEAIKDDRSRKRKNAETKDQERY